MKNSWQLKLSSLLQKQPDPANRPLRISLIGIGYELGGDDAAGVEIICRLKANLPAQNSLQLLDAGTAPENITGAVRRFQPDRIVLFDAADFGASPGEINLLDWRETTGFSASTHSLPLHIFAAYLSSELNCPVHLMGIQPLSLEFDTPLSPPVDRAVQEIIASMKEILTKIG